MSIEKKITELGSHELNELSNRLQDFCDERDWEKFHSPKNLVMALSVEVSELVEHFQWLTEQQSFELEEDAKARVSEELADSFNYLIRVADKLGVNLIEVANKKIDKNADKYPVELVRGSAKKYTEY